MSPDKLTPLQQELQKVVLRSRLNWPALVVISAEPLRSVVEDIFGWHDTTLLRFLVSFALAFGIVLLVAHWYHALVERRSAALIPDVHDELFNQGIFRDFLALEEQAPQALQPLHDFVLRIGSDYSNTPSGQLLHRLDRYAMQRLRQGRFHEYMHRNWSLFPREELRRALLRSLIAELAAPEEAAPASELSAMKLRRCVSRQPARIRDEAQ